MTAETVARPSAWSPFRQPVFRALWTAQLGANVGTWMQNVGAVWLMGSLGGSLVQIALVQTAATLPTFLLGVPAGALADIVDRRRMLLVTQAWMALWAMVLGVLSYGGLMTPNLLLILTFLIGIGSAANLPAWQALQPDLVPRADLPQTIALGAANTNLGRILGPTLGGLVIAVSDTYLAFVLNALAAVALFAVLATWRHPVQRTVLPAERLAAAVRAGTRYARNSPSLQAVLVRIVLFTAPANVVLTLLPILARRELGLDASGFGLLMGAFGLGAVLAATVLPRLRARLGTDRLIGAATLTFAVGCVTLGLARTWPVVALALGLSGFAWLLALATMNLAAQRAVPDWVRARGVGLYFVLMQGGLALGGVIWGIVGEGGSLEIAFFAAAASLVVLGLVGILRWRVAPVDDLDLRPSGHWPDPVVVVEPGLHDGPVLVTVEYQVVPARTREFAEAMRRVGRARGRVGTSAWGLYADPSRPGRFVETFIVESWSEHLRQHDRVTETDRVLEDAARAFLVEGSTSLTTHYISAYADIGP